MKKSGNSLQKRLLEKFLICNKIDINYIKDVLDNLWEADSTIGISLVDWKSELILNSRDNNDFNIEYATSNNNSLIKLILLNMQSLDIKNKNIKEVVVIHSYQIHITTYINAKRGLFLYLILDAQKTNLALSQSKIRRAIELLK